MYMDNLHWAVVPGRAWFNARHLGYGSGYVWDLPKAWI